MQLKHLVICFLPALSLGLAGCSSITTQDRAIKAGSAPATAPSAEDSDPFIWLEEVEGERALAWVKTQNARSRAELAGNNRYDQLFNEAIGVLDSEERIPFGRVYDGYVYNFWRGGTNIRGVWRRATVESYQDDAPEWENLLDIDALAKAENENWIYKRTTCLLPDHDRCMVELSRGGQSAAVFREFSVKDKSFVPGGFHVPQANTYVAWGDQDTLYVSTNLDENPQSKAGLPIAIREWKRGTELTAAKVVFAAEETDTLAWPQSFARPEGNYVLLTRGITFFNRVSEIVTPQRERIKLPIPNQADVFDVFEGAVITLLREDWSYRGVTYLQGTVVALDLETMVAERLYEPGPRDAVSDVRAGSRSIFITRLENVANKVTVLTRSSDDWVREELALPDNGVAFMMSRDPYRDDVAVLFENPVRPATIFHFGEDKAATVLKSAKDLFDAQDMSVVKREATSKDGTRIPYFLIGKAELMQRGSNAPTHLTAYGGFGHKNTPQYSTLDGKLWLERGGLLAVANIRGGGEFGPAWHEAARKTKRQNSYDDFYAVAEDLIGQSITSPDKLGISGGSNGGMLMGVAMTQRPELFGAVAMFVPVLDMVRYVEPLGGANWLSEYGDPKDEVEGAFLRSISPYHNLRPDADYPKAFIYTSTKDDLVHPAHSRKMAARMEQQGHEVLYFENVEGGHAGAANNSQEAQKQALLYNYFFQQLVDPAPEFEAYSAEAFFRTTSYGLSNNAGYSWSHENDKLLAHSDSSGVFNTIAVTLDGQDTPLTLSQTDAHFALSYFPNDDRVIVAADQGGNERFHIYVREIDGTLVDATPGDEVKASFGGWRSDGEVFYAWHNRRDPKSFDLYAIDADNYAETLIFENTGFPPGKVSPSGRWLVLLKPRTSADTNLYIVDLASEKPEPVLATAHEGNVAHSAYGFTPDESQLVYSTNEFGEFSQAWTYDLETAERAALIEADWDVRFVSYSPTGKYRIHGINADGRTEVTIVDTATGEELALNGVPDGEIGQVRFSHDETSIAFTLNTDTSPTNLYVAALGGEAVRLTDALDQSIDEDNLVTATVERFEASDGVTIPGILYRPKQASAQKPVPALVFVHGGPGGQSTRGYDATIQHLANNGYAVYAVNNRGSSGYGKTFFHLDDRRHGEEDLRDVVEAGDHLRSLDWVDGEKVGVMGGSYGGYLTAAALTFYPDKFEAGINMFGVTNWVRTLDSIPDFWASVREALFDEMGDPATDAERHRAISPLFHAEKITKPMLVVQGANDPRVLKVESDELVAAIRKNGVPVEYVVFPDEGHGFLRKENRITASKAYLRFLDKHLKGGSAN